MRLRRRACRAVTVGDEPLRGPRAALQCGRGMAVFDSERDPREVDGGIANPERIWIGGHPFRGLLGVKSTGRFGGGGESSGPRRGGHSTTRAMHVGGGDGEGGGCRGQS